MNKVEIIKLINRFAISIVLGLGGISIMKLNYYFVDAVAVILFIIAGAIGHSIDRDLREIKK
jgi:lipoprotein signal peptidase